MILRLLGLAAARFYGRHPWQLALAIAGIALGVAVYVGVDLANDSARRAFDLSAEAVGGRLTHRLLPAGDAIPERAYADLLLAGRVAAAAPVVEGVVALGSADGRRHALLGVDPVEETALRDSGRFLPGPGADIEALIATPGTVLLPDAALGDIEVAVGGRIRLFAGDAAREVEVVGTVVGLGAGAQVEPPIVADISTAQELLGRVGLLDRIDLVLTPAQAADLAGAAPAGTRLVAAGAPAGLVEMTRAFRTNLMALGLLALVVGMFLVYATMSFAVVQRRAVVGLLRSLGTTRRRLLATFIGEAVAIGLLGTLLGLALGHVLARGLVELVLQTIGDLSFSSALGAVRPSGWIYVRGAALGVGATALAALVPALEAARVEPAAAMSRASLEQATRARIRFAVRLAVPLLGAAALLLLAADRSLVIGFAVLFLVLCAGAVAVPAMTEGLTRALVPAARRSGNLAALMAIRGVGASLSRTGVAAAALAVAVATVIGISVMIASFRASLVAWLDTTLTADVYLTAVSPESRDALGAERIAALAALPEVEGLSLSRVIRVTTALGELSLRATTPGPDGWGVDLVAGETDRALARLAGAPGVLVAEPLAYRFGLEPGGTLELPTPSGAVGLEILGVFRDYATVGSALIIDRETYRRYWRDDRVTGIGVHLRPDVEADDALDRLRGVLGGDASIAVRSTASLERLSLAVFDRTFEITEVLRLLASTVAFLGVLSAALAIQLERTRELAILRAIGFSRRQLGALILVETGLLGAAAGLAAVPIGTVLAALLVYVINRRSFGWSMDFVVPVEPLVLGVALAIGAALLAGLYPAARASRTDLDAALRDE